MKILILGAVMAAGLEWLAAAPMEGPLAATIGADESPARPPPLGKDHSINQFYGEVSYKIWL